MPSFSRAAPRSLQGVRTARAPPVRRDAGRDPRRRRMPPRKREPAGAGDAAGSWATGERWPTAYCGSRRPSAHVGGEREGRSRRGQRSGRPAPGDEAASPGAGSPPPDSGRPRRGQDQVGRRRAGHPHLRGEGHALIEAARPAGPGSPSRQRGRRGRREGERHDGHGGVVDRGRELAPRGRVGAAAARSAPRGPRARRRRRAPPSGERVRPDDEPPAVRGPAQLAHGGAGADGGAGEDGRPAAGKPPDTGPGVLTEHRAVKSCALGVGARPGWARAARPAASPLPPGRAARKNGWGRVASSDRSSARPA